MAIEDLDHYTVNVTDLESSVRFYEEVIGLKKGAPPRPEFDGAWLYLGTRPIVHLFAGHKPEGTANGALDHVAIAEGRPGVAHIVGAGKDMDAAFKQ